MQGIINLFRCNNVENTLTDSASFPTKFSVSSKQAECVENGDEDEISSICSQLKAYGGNHCTEVLLESQFPSKIRPSRNNGFVQTVIDCYNNHHNLVIRPDDLWTAIMVQFSFYINRNAEEFRSKFVNFGGKRELNIKLLGSLHSAPYDRFVTAMTTKIDEYLIDQTVKDWILPQFSTTTANDIISCGVVFMAITKKYFNFGFCLMCGIPYVTLEGTVADYETILVRLETLKKYKLNEWYDMLVPILSEFVAAKKGKANINFWKRICNHLGEGSGPRYISGWLTAFTVFDENGDWMDPGNESHRSFSPKKIKGPWPVININEIPTGVVNVDVKISDGCVEYDSVMFAGHIGYEILKKRTLKPQIGWGIALKSSAEDVKKLHRTLQENNRIICSECRIMVTDLRD